MNELIEKINYMIQNYKIDPGKSEIMVTSTDLEIDFNQLLGNIHETQGFESDHIKFIVIEKIVEILEFIKDYKTVRNKWRVVKSLITGFYNDYV